jgi:hypothetical protein
MNQNYLSRTSAKRIQGMNQRAVEGVLLFGETELDVAEAAKA